MRNLLKKKNYSATKSLALDYKQILFQSPVALLVINCPSYSVEFLNNHFYNLTEAKQDAHLVSIIIDELKVHLDHVWKTGMELKLREEHVFIYGKYEIESNWWNLYYRPVINDDGAVQSIIVTICNVTEQVIDRKKTEQNELWLNDMAFATVPLSDIGFWELDALTGKFTASGNMATIYKVDNNRLITLDLARERIYEEDKPFILDFFSSLLYNKSWETFELEWRLTQPMTTAVKYVRTKGKAFYNKSGILERIAGSVADITEFKISERRYRRIFESSPAAIWEEDYSMLRHSVLALKQSGVINFKEHFAKYEDELLFLISSVVIKDMNEAALRLQGLSSKEEFFGNLPHFFVKETLPSFIEAIEFIAKGGGRFETESVIKHTNGHLLDVVVRIDFPTTEDYSNIIVTLFDITERKRVENALRESEERFRILARTLPQLVWMSDNKGFFEFVSDQWKQYFGRNIEGVHTIADIVHPEDYERLRSDWENCLQNNLPLSNEVRLLSSQGEYRWHQSQSASIKNEMGETVRWIGTWTDVHDQKTNTRSLEGIVKERTRDLERSNDDLQQFAHVVSHDLKEPVRKIQFYSSSLVEEAENALSPNAKSCADKIYKAARRMHLMIDGVLQHSILNELEMPMTGVCLTKVLKDVSADLELLIKDKKASLIFENLPAIDGHLILIHQLFYNIINNALKFSKKDVAPVIKVWTEPLITQSGENATEFVQILIQDNGIGFSPEKNEEVFKPFFRLHPKDRYEGTGLGLSFCKKIIEKHFGEISADAEENQGTLIKITLPRTQMQKANCIANPN